MRKLLLAMCCSLSFAWSADAQFRATSSEGRKLFHSPAISTNGLSCANCHASFDESKQNDGLIRAGHSLYNAGKRSTFWGKDPELPGAFPDISSAAAICVKQFMLNDRGLTAQQIKILQLYLDAITRRPLPAPLPIAPAADKTGRYDGFGDGNKLLGRDLFYAACNVCHPNGNTGIAPNPIPRDRPVSYYAKVIREGDGLGAVLSGVDPNAYMDGSRKFMPFFGADRLSKEQIRHIIAFMKSLPPAP
jgi:mono/diheme cytochrome c family protein